MSTRPARGRRPGAPDTRAEILEAARSLFAQRGFAGTTVRAIGGAAGVDPALVHHYFGSKESLLLACVQPPVDPREVLAGVAEGARDDLGHRLTGTVLGLWEDPELKPALLTLLRTGISEPGSSLVPALLQRVVLGPVLEQAGVDDVERRAALVAAQVAGVVLVRHVLRIEPVASMPLDELVVAVAPGVQRYLTDDLGGP